MNHSYFLFSLALILSLAFTQPGMGQEREKERKIRKAYDDSRAKDYDLSFMATTSNSIDLDFDVAGGENYLLLIAVDQYKYWKPLNNAVKDARDVKKVLMEKYGFDNSHVYELLNQEVTPENVRKQFEALKAQGSNIDKLLIYYSGHGYYDPSFDLGYWVPAQGRTNRDATSTYIPNDEIRNYIKDLQFRHIFLVADACFSGSMFDQEEEDPTRGADAFESVKSRFGLSSGNLEVVSDGKKGQNSPFARYFIQYLEDNLQDRVFAKDLALFVERNVEDETEQDPIWGELRGVGSEGGEFIFELQGTELTEKE